MDPALRGDTATAQIADVDGRSTVDVRQAAGSRADIESLVQGNLPTAPSVAISILEITQNPDATVDQIAAVLSRDPVLTAKVLQVANSPLFFRGGDAIATLSRAVTLLGFRTVKIIALGFSLISELSAAGAGSPLRLEDYWHRSLINGVVTSTAMRSQGHRGHEEEAFLLGLLSEIGRLVLLQGAEERYSMLAANVGGWPTAAEESAYFGYDHHAVTQATLAHWSLPVLFRDSVSVACNRSGVADQTTILFGRTLRLAWLIADVLFSTDKAGSLAILTIEADNLYHGGIEGIDSLVAEASQNIEQAATLFDIRIPEGLSYQTILDQARSAMIKACLDTAVDLDQERVRASELQVIAQTDALTGLANRRALDSHITFMTANTCAVDAVGVLMVDIDKFKAINDCHGHSEGDAVLREVARRLNQCVRDTDVLARYGGEEFILILSPPFSNALVEVAERARRAICREPITLSSGTRIHVTVSIGGTCGVFVHGKIIQNFIDIADSALYDAKRSGRDRVIIRE